MSHGNSGVQEAFSQVCIIAATNEKILICASSAKSEKLPQLKEHLCSQVSHIENLGFDTWKISELFPLKENERLSSEDQIQSQEKQKPFVNTQRKWKVKLLVVQLCLTLWTVARQAPLSMGFSRQEHWSGLLCLPPGDPPNPGMEAGSPALQGLLQRWATREALLRVCLSLTNPVEYWGFACQIASVASNSLRPPGLQHARFLCPWDFSRQEYLSGLPFPPPGDLLDPGIEPTSLMSPAFVGGLFYTSTTWEASLRFWRHIL